MMLSNEDINNELESGGIKVVPCQDGMVKSAGLTLHLGEDLLKPLPGVIVDVKEGSIPDYNQIKITADSPYKMEPGEFILGHTYELVSVGSSIGFFIEGRSTLARVGLTIVQTAMLVYPGHKDRSITLELANHGPNPILLYPKMKIARAALFYLKTPSSKEYDSDGKYREQLGVGIPIFKDEVLPN